MGGIQLIRILTLVVLSTRAQGTGLGLPQYYVRHPGSFHTFKDMSVAPISKAYDIELVKPVSQMPQRKRVPLFLVPQTSVHVYPPTAKHLPAIEIPLDEPMVLTAPTPEVTAPMGFNVLCRGNFLPFYTVALLAPVPPGTHISRDTPVIINMVYAISKMPQVPSYHKLKTQNPVTQTTTTTTEKYPSNAIGGPLHDMISLDADTVSVPLQIGENDQVPFDNAKESPVLLELRLEALQRQVQQLQAQILRLKRLRGP